MAKTHRIFSFFFFSFTLFITNSESILDFNIQKNVPIRNVHDYLHKYWLPKGLIPTNVKSYDPHLALEIKLEHPCYVEIAGKLFYYEKLIRGHISYGIIYELSGLKVKKYFSWVPVTRIDVDWDKKLVKIYYQGNDGYYSEELPVTKFEEITPMCKKENMDWLWMFFVSDL